MHIFLLFVSAGVLFDSVFSLSVSLKCKNLQLKSTWNYKYNFKQPWNNFSWTAGQNVRWYSAYRQSWPIPFFTVFFLSKDFLWSNKNLTWISCGYNFTKFIFNLLVTYIQLRTSAINIEKYSTLNLKKESNFLFASNTSQFHI